MLDPIADVTLRPATGAAAPDKPVSPGMIEGGDADFAALLGDAIAGMSQKLRNAEAVSIAGIKGMASTQDVVETVMAAEQSLQAAIAVRDKIVSAYMEISRMAI